jgi:uncharacterized LabA/DUF88 family protein
VYVDGFNLYYGAVRGTPFKWLNLTALAKQLIPQDYTITKVKYFTARVSGVADLGAPKRQQAYLSALATLPEMEIHHGRFLSKTVWRPITNFPVAGATIHSPTQVTLPAGTHDVDQGTLAAPSKLTVGVYPGKTPGRHRRKSVPRPLANALVAEVHTMEEKGSDVNIAAHLLNDAWKGLFEAAVLISNDTDLITPIRMVSVERKKPVFVVCPAKWQMAPGLQQVATYTRHIHKSMLAAAQFADPIPGTTIRKPRSW